MAGGAMSVDDKTAMLRKLAYLNGGTCAAIGIGHVLKGSEISVGIGPEPNASVDSQEAFYGAIFAGYGAAWIWTARQPQPPSQLVRFLSGVMALGGVARVISMRRRGLPHPFWSALTAVELVVPAALVWLDDDCRRSRLRPIFQQEVER
jgi:hypothetical protein